MTRVVFLELAEEEMLEAATYYENQAPGLGEDFLAQVQHAVDLIAQNPRSGGIMRGDIRRRLVPRFPFGILYHIYPVEIVASGDRRRSCHASPEAPRVLAESKDPGMTFTC